MLPGLDDIDWSALDEEGMPDLLRAYARGEEPEEDIMNVLYDQGVRMPGAGAAALPFLIELAERGDVPERAYLLETAALVNEISVTDPSPAWRAAWTAVEPRVAALLDDPEPDMRRAAITGLAASGATGPLRARFAVEDDPGLRIRLAAALADPALAADAQPEVAFLGILAGGPSPDLAADALAACNPVLLRENWGGELRVLQSLAQETRPGFVHRLLAAGRGLGAATALLAGRRDLDGEFAGPIAALSPDPEALRLLAVLSVPHAGLFAGLLGDAEVGDIAVWALARLGDGRAIAPLVRRVRDDAWHHTRAHWTGVTSVGGLPSIGEVLQALPGERVAAVLPAVRERLRHGEHGERLDYLNTIIAWGALAAEALPEVAGLDLPLARRAEEAVRDAPARPPAGDLAASEVWTRVRAARAEWRSGGDHTVAARVLIDVVTASLDGGQASPAARAALVHLAEMGAGVAAAPLARRVLDHSGGLFYFGGWRAFAEDGEWRRAARALL